MIVGEVKSQIDSIWNDFWSGGLSNPLSVMEQITYLLFIKRLDELHTRRRGKGRHPENSDGTTHFPGRPRWAG